MTTTDEIFDTDAIFMYLSIGSCKSWSERLAQVKRVASDDAFTLRQRKVFNRLAKASGGFMPEMDDF